MRIAREILEATYWARFVSWAVSSAKVADVAVSNARSNIATLTGKSETSDVNERLRIASVNTRICAGVGHPSIDFFSESLHGGRIARWEGATMFRALTWPTQTVILDFLGKMGKMSRDECTSPREQGGLLEPPRLGQLASF